MSDIVKVDYGKLKLDSKINPKIESSSNEVPNMYSSVDKKFLPNYHNPYFRNHMIGIPFRMLIVGASGHK